MGYGRENGLATKNDHRGGALASTDASGDEEQAKQHKPQPHADVPELRQDPVLQPKEPDQHGLAVTHELQPDSQGWNPVSHSASKVSRNPKRIRVRSARDDPTHDRLGDEVQTSITTTEGPDYSKDEAT